MADNMIAWNIGGLSIYLPTDSGIAASGDFWIFYGTNLGNSHIVCETRSDGRARGIN
ncbi:MAG: hypothetical protein U0X20_18615 [Caldilineaceae bacterium]